MTQQEYFDEILKVEEELNNEGIFCETYTYPNDFDKVDVNIEWGDWKHDHLYCDYLMRKKGWAFDSESITDEDGSDCYSSTHTYKRVC